MTFLRKPDSFVGIQKSLMYKNNQAFTTANGHWSSLLQA